MKHRLHKNRRDKTASALSDATGLTEFNEGLDELRKNSTKDRVSGLPDSVPAAELERRLEDAKSTDKLTNPRLMGVVGGLTGAGAGLAIYRRPAGALLGIPSGLGAASGAYIGEKTISPMITSALQAKIDEKKMQENAQKTASLAEYSVLFDEMDRGAFGDHVKEALFGVCEGMTSSLQSHHAKTASSPFHTTEEEARQARLDQLLRKF